MVSNRITGNWVFASALPSWLRIIEVLLPSIVYLGDGIINETEAMARMGVRRILMTVRWNIPMSMLESIPSSP